MFYGDLLYDLLSLLSENVQNPSFLQVSAFVSIAEPSLTDTFTTVIFELTGRALRVKDLRRPPYLFYQEGTYWV
jgi:hypothetical protein